MIVLKNIKISFLEKIIYNNLNWQITEGSRIGLVGDNGAGKTTLFKIIIGECKPDDGEIIIPKRKKIGYLPQDLVILSNYLLRDYLKEIAGIEKLEKKLKENQEKLAKIEEGSNNFQEIAGHYEQISHHFDMIGGYFFEARAKSILQGLGFKEEDWMKPCSSFSGGWKMRVAIAGLLVSSPDILLLDEPTNHMDTESLEWLENWLRKYRGTLAVISHDRYFLDKVVWEIAEIHEQKISFYKGNYSFYLKEKGKREEIEKKNQKHLLGKKAHLEKFIERFRYKATKASQVQSRIKMLEKIAPIKDQKTSNHVHFYFPSSPRSGEEVVVLKNVSHGYGQKKVLQDINITINRSDRLALVGVNGVGKSTLLRIISGTENPGKGRINWGYQVKIAFFSQESVQNLNYQHSVWEEIDRSANKLNDQEKRDLLGSFLFTGEDIYKAIHRLSGGEKSRLALAKLLLDESNLLILDEPGNHLDFRTKDVFYDALKQYKGTIIIVSHDRFFLDQLVNRVIEIKNGKVHSYPGNYSYFIRKRENNNSPEKLKEYGEKKTDNRVKPSLLEKNEKRMQAEKRNRQYRLIKVIDKEILPLEDKIHYLEKQKNEIEEKLCHKQNLQDSEKIQRLLVNLDIINKNLGNGEKKKN